MMMPWLHKNEKKQAPDATRPVVLRHARLPAPAVLLQPRAAARGERGRGRGNEGTKGRRLQGLWRVGDREEGARSWCGLREGGRRGGRERSVVWTGGAAGREGQREKLWNVRERSTKRDKKYVQIGTVGITTGW